MEHQYTIQIKLENIFDLEVICLGETYENSDTQYFIADRKSLEVKATGQVPPEIAKTQLYLGEAELLVLLCSPESVEDHLKIHFESTFKSPEIQLKISKEYTNNDLVSVDYEDVEQEEASVEIYKHFSQPVTVPEEVSDHILVEVFWGTNRTKLGASSINTFANKRSRELFLGISKISVPADRERGSLNRQSRLSSLFFDLSPDSHFFLTDSQTLNQKAFAEKLSAALTTSASDEILLFIHGYNNSFEDTLCKAAQLSYDLSFPGKVCAFSWPSAASVQGYIGDLDSAFLQLFHSQIS